MKKILFLCLLMFSFIMGVNADTITFNELPNKLKESLTYEEFLEEGITCDIAKTDNSLDITCDLKSDGKYTTHFDYNGSVLSYSSDAKIGSIQKFFDSLWILQLENNGDGYFGHAIDYSSGYEESLKSFYNKVYEVNNSSTFSMNLERGNINDNDDNTDSGNNNTGDNNNNTDSGNNNTGNNNNNTDSGNDNTGDNNNNTDSGNNNTGDNNNNTDSGNNNTGDNNVVVNPATGNIFIFVVVVLILISMISIIFYKNSLDNK